MSPIQWAVRYNDNIEELGFDNLSPDAFNNPNLISFKLKYNGKVYSVDLKTGTIILNGFKIHSPFGNQNYRLIYYRVKSASIPDGEIKEDIPHIGWQVTINGKNHKRIFKITDKIILAKG